MMSYKDRTFCSNKNCQNECGRQLTKADREGAAKLRLPLALADFCRADHGAKGSFGSPNLNTQD